MSKGLISSYIELQGTTLKISPENFMSRNLNKLAVALKLGIQHCPLEHDKFIKSNTWHINLEHLRCDRPSTGGSVVQFQL